MDVKQILIIIDTLKFFIIAQCTRLETAFDNEYTAAEKALCAYNGTSNNGLASKQQHSLKKNQIKSEQRVTTSSKRGRDEIDSREKEKEKERRREHERAQIKVADKIVPRILSAADILTLIKGVLMDAWRYLRNEDSGLIFESPVSYWNNQTNES